MKCLCYLFLSFLLLKISNSLFSWEPRTLKCQQLNCYLSKTGFGPDGLIGTSDPDTFKPAACQTEQNGIISTCDIECDGAERDSVISKKPTDYRYCNRFFTYNAQKTSEGKWAIWRKGACALANITMTVHCAFPISGSK